MTKRAIPQILPTSDPALKVVKENLEVIMGQRGGKLQPLPPTATLTDLINSVNAIIEKLQ
jgi:hypothetical protein